MRGGGGVIYGVRECVDRQTGVEEGGVGGQG